MIDLLLIALLQTTEPEALPETPPTEHVQVVAPTETAEEEDPDDEVSCRTGNVIDSRVREERVCQTERQRRRTQANLRRMQDEVYNPVHGCREFGC